MRNGLGLVEHAAFEQSDVQNIWPLKVPFITALELAHAHAYAYAGRSMA